MVVFKLDDAASDPIAASINVKSKIDSAVRDLVKKLVQHDARMMSIFPSRHQEALRHELALFYEYLPYPRLDLTPLELVNRALVSADLPEHYVTLVAVHAPEKNEDRA